MRIGPWHADCVRVATQRHPSPMRMRMQPRRAAAKHRAFHRGGCDRAGADRLLRRCDGHSSAGEVGSLNPVRTLVQYALPSSIADAHVCGETSPAPTRGASACSTRYPALSQSILRSAWHARTHPTTASHRIAQLRTACFVCVLLARPVAKHTVPPRIPLPTAVLRRIDSAAPLRRQNGLAGAAADLRVYSKCATTRTSTCAAP